MRELHVNEVDVGCDACQAVASTRVAGTLFVAGVVTGVAKDALNFCSPHYAGFRAAMDGVSSQRQSAEGRASDE